MRKLKVKTEKISGFRIAVMSISILMLSFIMAFSMLFGISMMKTMKTTSGSNVTLEKGETTIRKEVPAGSVSPVESDALSNIGYMAYTMDHQSFYHAFAHNTTQAGMMGFKYSQITQSWKDYKSAQYSGEPFSVMVASDLSFSQFVKSASQSCFLGDNKALMRGGSKPSGNGATPFNISWATSDPTIYDADGYKETYGEFSTEISVYVINEKTLEGADPVVEKGDGIFEQTYYLNANAGGWYQYGMMTRGGFKKLPEFNSIVITFTFNEKWEILESYCEEKAVITPKAFGGAPMDSNSVTTTIYDYSVEGFKGDDRYIKMHGGDFDGEGHYDYYNDFFIKYKDADAGNNDKPGSSLNILDLLGNGFGSVLTTGQQFDLSVNLGETPYAGKIFLKLADTNDILNSLEVKLSLGKSSDKQDLYVEMNKGNVSLYYSNDFALTANINEVKTSVNNVIDFVKQLSAGFASPDAAGYAAAEEEQTQSGGSGLNFEDLLTSLKPVETENEVSIVLKSDNLLGLGIGVDAALVFNKKVDEDDSVIYSFKSADLNSISYNKTVLDLKAGILPDDSGAEIARKSSETPANLADYIDSVYDVLTSDAIRVQIGLDDKLVKGLTLDAVAYVVVGSDVAANVSITAEYKGVSLSLDAAYIYEGSSYGKIYLHVKEFNGQSLDAKVFCDIGDTVKTVKDVIALFSDNNDSGVSAMAEEAAAAQDTLADIINRVLNLNFSEVIGKVKGNDEVISVEIDVDAILTGLGIDLESIIKDNGVDLGLEDYSAGKLSLAIDADGTITGSLSNIGFGIEICGWNDAFTVIEDKQNYLDIGNYLEGVNALLEKPAYDVAITFDGAQIGGVDLTDLKVEATATVAVEGQTIRVQLPATVSYDVFGIALTAYYSVNLSDGSYGDIYLHVTSVTVEDKTYALNAKVYCHVNEVVDSVKAIIDKFASKADSEEVAGGEGGVSAQSEEGEKSVLAKAIDLLLSLNYSEIINATNEKLSVTLNVDEILSAFDISLGGVSFGELKLDFEPAKRMLSGNLDDLGLTVTVSGNDEELAAFETDGFVNLQAYLNSAVELLNKKSFNLSLTFVGNKNIKSDIDLEGLNVGVEAQLAFVDDFGGAEVNVSYLAVSYMGMSIELSAHYEVSFDGGYGLVYIVINKVNEVGVSIKVKANIADAVDAVTAIIDSFKPAEPQTIAEEGVEEGNAVVSGVVKAILKLDIQELLNSLTATDDLAELTLDLDKFLAGFDLGVNLGTVNLKYYPADCTLTGSDAHIGLDLIEIKGSDEELASFDKEGYLDAVQAIRFAEDLIDEGRKIADAEAVVFHVNIDATIDGKAVEVEGFGEAVWGETVKVALSLLVSVDNTEKFELNFVYEPEDSENLVILTLNEIGTKISKDEIDTLVDSFSELIGLFSGNNSSDNGSYESNGEAVAPDEANGYALSVGGVSIEEILADDTVKSVLKSVLEFLNDFVVEIRSVNSEEDIYNLVVKHTGGLTVTLGANNGLFVTVAEANKYTATASAEAGNGTTVSELHDALLANEESKYEFLKLDEFVKKLYTNFFDEIEKATLKDILGEGPYSVELTLTGANSAIGALEAVTVTAELYYEEGIVVDTRTTKLMQAVLNMNIGGTEVKATVSYQGRMVFVELNKIGTTNLSDVKFKTDVIYVFDAVEQLVRLVTDTNLVKTIGKFMGNGEVSEGDVETIAAFASLSTEEGEPAPSALAKLIDAVLSLDFNEAFRFDKENKSAEINIDSLSQALLGIDIGTVKATADSEEHKLDATVTVGGNESAWLELHAIPCDVKYDALNSEGFMDIGFIATLLSDLAKTATNDAGEIYTLYSFNGSIAIDIKNIPVLGTIDLRFNNATITAGLDENGDFYFSLAASMQKKSLLGYTITANRDISITYSNGLVVLGRDIGTGSEIYKVVTIEYLIDNLADKQNSPVRWLLGTSDTAWGLIFNAVKLNLDSGLTKPRTYVLYEQVARAAAENSFDFSSYLNGLEVKTGEYDSTFGNGASLVKSMFNLSDNYYALDLNANALTGGTISTLYAAILRDESGITGFKAFANAASMVDITLDFGTYLEGKTEVYGGRVAVEDNSVTQNTFYNYVETENVTAADFSAKTYYIYGSDGYVEATEYVEGEIYFEKVNTEYYVKDGDNYVLATEFVEGTQYYVYTDSTSKLGEVAIRNYLAYAIEKFGFDRNHEFERTSAHIANHTNPIFGCFDTSDSSYASSDVLETIYLDVYASADAVTPVRTLEVLYSSTVKLIRDFPEFADESHSSRIVYFDKNSDSDTALGREIYILDGSITIVEVEGNKRVSIYKAEETAVEVEFVFGNGINVDGQDSVTAAFAYGETLPEYPLNDYSFLGWYLTSNHTGAPVTTVRYADVAGGKLTVYGKYIKAVYEAENGVNYTFDSRYNGYYVSGTNNNIGAYYNNADMWLEIAAEINGYSVLYIGASAFENPYADSAHSLVNVLVPETVTAVYDKAFFDNKALRKVVFFADKVFFGGRANSDGKTSAFYGCYENSDISNKTNVNFTVYYNSTQNNPYQYVSTTNNTIDGAWNRIYFADKNNNYLLSTKTTGWSYAEFDVVVNRFDVSELPAELNLNSLISNGLQFTAYNEAGILANTISEWIKSQLSGRVLCTVEVSNALPLNGKRHSIEITITEIEEVVAKDTDIDVVVKFENAELYSGTVENVKADANLADIYSTLNFNGKADYTFIGWYLDAEFAKPAPATNDGTVSELYAKIVKNTFTAANGVIYTFVAENGSVPAHYAVSGFGSGSDGIDYTANDAWLVIANEISGYPVTSINSEAFARHNLKNVVVPYNVTAIGEKAFLDNYGMLNIVMLADTVTLHGSVGGKNLPFYGCSTGNGTNVTSLNVYYNSISNESDERWYHFRDGNNFIGMNGAGGSVNSAGTWGYVNFTVTEGYYMSDFGYKDGLVTSAVNDDYLKSVKADVVNHLNSITAESGIIYKYSVVVKDEIKEGIHFITVTISDDTANAWNKLVLEGSDIQIELTPDIEIVNGMYFVKQGATVTVRPVSGNEGLTQLIVYGDSGKSTVLYDSEVQEVTANMSFEMPDSLAYVVGNRAHLPITEITLRSIIQVDGFDNYVNGFYELSSYSINEDEALTYNVESNGHTFLGWAYEDSSNLLVFESTVHNRVYYAVWAVSRDKGEVSNARIENGEFTADIVDGKAASIYGWYAYKTAEDRSVVFDTPVTTASLTATTTRVYPRMMFTFNYEMIGLTSAGTGNTDYYFARGDANSGDNDRAGSGNSYTNSFNILEGTELRRSWNADSSGNTDKDVVLLIQYQDDESNTFKQIYFRIKNDVEKKMIVTIHNWKSCYIGLEGAFQNADVPDDGKDYNSFMADGNKDLTIRATSRKE